MSSKRKYLWILAMLLAVPMAATNAPAAAYQGGGYEAAREEARGDSHRLPTNN